VSLPERATQPLGILSRRALEELGTLQTLVQRLCGERNAALRRLLASRYAATVLAQREFWLEFAWSDQEYRVAVQRLAEFCRDHRNGPRRSVKLAGAT
jgi:hypothetical protein